MTLSKFLPKGLPRRCRETFKPFLIMILSITAFRSVCADWNDVPTGSMNPTILEGDRIFVNKLAYGLRIPFTTVPLAHWAQPEQFDIVVCFSPTDRTRLVKRVIGLPGDKIQLIDNHLFINDQPAEYLSQNKSVSPNKERQSRYDLWFEEMKGESHSIQIRLPPSKAAHFGPFTVPPGQYFMMGDNRDNSFDSRYFGCVERSQIIGRATAVVLSVDPSHSYAPRWKRFMSGLL